MTACFEIIRFIEPRRACSHRGQSKDPLFVFYAVIDRDPFPPLHQSKLLWSSHYLQLRSSVTDVLSSSVYYPSVLSSADSARAVTVGHITVKTPAHIRQHTYVWLMLVAVGANTEQSASVIVRLAMNFAQLS